jgi:DNA-binding NarL/FixJ family response regulator
MLHLLVVSGVRFYREGLSEVLAARAGIAGCSAALDAAGAGARLLAAPRPDVVLLDVAVPEARELVASAARSGARVVVMAVGEADDALLDWAELGVAGYVGRDGSLEELCETVEAAARGELRCSPTMAASLLRHLSALAGIVRSARHAAPPVRLTSRELEIAALIAGGLSNKGIARHLGIEVATAKNHVHNILRKLQVEHRHEAADWLRLHGPAPAPAGEGMDRRFMTV